LAHLQQEEDLEEQSSRSQNPRGASRMRPKIVAGTFSAINWKFPPSASLSLLNHQIPAPFRILNSRFCYRRNSQVLKMPQADLQNHSPDIKEPSPKVPKHQHDNIPSYLLRVKKLSENAVLPSRASPLSAGYDLSRYIAKPSSSPFIFHKVSAGLLANLWFFFF